MNVFTVALAGFVVAVDRCGVLLRVPLFGEAWWDLSGQGLSCFDCWCRRGGQIAQLRRDSAGREFRIFAEKTPGQRQTGAPLPQRQEDVALTAEVHQITLPMAVLGNGQYSNPPNSTWRVEEPLYFVRGI